jgi:D-tyrosyl-tRNA(Tyr) deacylase
MRAVVQRVSSASVCVDGDTVGAIDGGLLVLLGVTHDDGPEQAAWLAKKLVELRVFADPDGKMNRSVVDAGGGFLVVSQFTLYGTCRKGRRPSYARAARPEHAEPLYLAFCAAIRAHDCEVQTGRFGAMMDVALVNDGPVTLIVETS